MSAPKRILFVVNHARWFLTHRMAIAEAAVAAGYDVHVATPASEYTSAISARGLTWHAIPLTRSGRNPVGEIRILIALYRLYRRLRADIVHHVSMKPVLYGTLAARAAGVPAVVNAMTGLGHLFLSSSPADRLTRRAVALLFRVVVRHPRMRIIFQNEDDLELFVSRSWIRAEDALLVRSGVDTNAFAPAETSSERGVPTVMLPGRMLRTKGVPEFIEAAKLLRSRGVIARFVLVGGPDSSNPATLTEDELRQAVNSGSAEYLGEREDMVAIYGSADIVCLPSHREGMPKVLLEAAACGLPVVATDVPGCRHAVEDGVSGLLVPLQDPERLADALERLITDPTLRERMGREGRARVEREFSTSRLAESTLQIYSELTPIG